MLKSLRPRCIIPFNGRGCEEKLEHMIWRAAWLRDAEPAAAASEGITLAQLMERAGEAAFSVCKQYFPSSRHWLILVGPGNNGGDGYVIARHAKAMGAKVTVAAIPPKKPLPVEAATAKSAWESSQGTEVLIDENWSVPPGVDLIVDGLLGTGLTGSPRGLYSQVIERVNNVPVPRFAIDIPSGLNAETGEVSGQCFKADHTATFICLKPGLLTGSAREYVGQLHYHALGLSVWLLDPERRESLVCERSHSGDLPLYFDKPRSATAHKGTNGRVLLIGGDLGYGGAIIMASEAALISGAGLVRVFTREEHVTPILVRTPEVMVRGVSAKDTASIEQSLLEDLAWCDTIAIGPGLGQGQFGAAALKTVLAYAGENPNKTVVFDADALNIFSSQYLKKAVKLPYLPHSILTPHPGEAARLLETKVKDVEEDRLQSALRVASILGGCCILKGPGSVVATSNTSKKTIVDAGNAGMATGGMGDVLTGVVAGLGAQKLFGGDVDALARVGCLVHSTAADLAVEANLDGGLRGLRATDLLPYITRCINTGNVKELNSAKI